MDRDPARHDGAERGTREDSIPPLPTGEPFVPRARFGPVRLGPALAGLAVAAAVAAGIVLLAGRRGSARERVRHARQRVALLAAQAPTRRHALREARGRGFWAGVAASAGSAIASTLARRIAEDVLATAARQRPAEEPVRG